MQQKKIWRFNLLILNIAFFALFPSLLPAQSQVSLNAQVTDKLTLKSSGTDIELWGIEPRLKDQSSLLNLQARTALEELIGNKKIICTIKKKANADQPLKAQCQNTNEEDLSLFLIQKGFATADRSEIVGTVFESVYLGAEKSAYDDLKGIWAEDDTANIRAEGRRVIYIAMTIIAIFLLVLATFAYYLLRGFGQVVEAQNKTVDLAEKERALKNKEKYVIATMLNAEIQANRAKIEAYLTIYEETLNDFTSSHHDTYNSSEIIQKQPGLGRSVFDGNTNKLELLGGMVASRLIHYYARIKTVPDYIEIKPGTPIKEAGDIVRKSIDSAKKLDEISEDIIQLLIDNSLIKPSSLDSKH